jgi:hypothetical protein
MQLVLSSSGEALQQQRADAVSPGCVDDRFMSQNGIGTGGLRCREKKHERKPGTQELFG